MSDRILVTIDNNDCCLVCAQDNDRPGKFEGNGDLEGIATCLLLYQFSLDSSEDDYMTNEGWGYCGRFGQYLLFDDHRGFVSYEDCGTVDKAQKRFDDLYSDGWGASEDDFYIHDGRHGIGYSVSFEGKHIGTFERESRARAAVSLEMRKHGYYPSVWRVNDHGNVSLIEVW